MAALTRAAAIADINAQLPTNGQGLITAAVLRSVLLSDIVNSAMYPQSDTGSGLIAAAGATGLSTATTITPITAATATYTAAEIGNLIARANGGAAMTDFLPGTIAGVLPARSVITVYNADPSGILSIGTLSGAGIVNAPFNGLVLLGPGQSASFLSTGANYLVLGAPDRTRLGADTTFFVATTGSDLNPGIVASAPFLTRQAAYDTFAKLYTANNHTPTCKLADGTYTDQFSATIPLVGVSNQAVNSPSGFTFEGHPGSPDSVVINAANGSWGFASASPFIIVKDMKLTGGNNAAGLLTFGGAIAFNDIDFGAFGSGQSWQVGILTGAVEALGSYSISGGAANHIFTDGPGGYATFGDAAANVQITGGVPINFSDAFVHASQLSAVGIGNWAFTLVGGTTVTGKRCAAELNASILTGAGTAACQQTYFPGSIDGTSATGGQCN